MHQLLDLLSLSDYVVLDSSIGKHVGLHVERVECLDVVLFDHLELSQVTADQFEHDLELVELLEMPHLVGQFVANPVNQLDLLRNFLLFTANR